ncbi:MAG TPA: hypothetical protein VFM13_03720 [Gaiellaceae bacterium]|nr:hypothetical protein [Gaiellaceae bacterium]
MTELPDDLLEPDDSPEPADEPESDDDSGLSAEESLGLLPPD